MFQGSSPLRGPVHGEALCQACVPLLSLSLSAILLLPLSRPPLPRSLAFPCTVGLDDPSLPAPRVAYLVSDSDGDSDRVLHLLRATTSALHSPSSSSSSSPFRSGSRFKSASTFPSSPSSASAAVESKGWSSRRLFGFWMPWCLMWSAWRGSNQQQEQHGAWKVSAAARDGTGGCLQRPHQQERWWMKSLLVTVTLSTFIDTAADPEIYYPPRSPLRQPWPPSPSPAMTLTMGFPQLGDLPPLPSDPPTPTAAIP